MKGRQKFSIHIDPRLFIKVNAEFLNDLLDNNLCPVIAPIGVGLEEGDANTYNVNADVAAAVCVCCLEPFWSSHLIE